MPYEYPPDEPVDTTWSEMDAASGAETTTLATITDWILLALMIAAFVALATCIAIFPIACAYVAAALYLCWITVEAGRAFWREIRTSRSLWSAIGGALNAAGEAALIIIVVFTPTMMGPLLFLWMLIAAIRWVVT